jgi:hypothetical protein
LTQPENSRTKKASGGGNGSIAEACPIGGRGSRIRYRGRAIGPSFLRHKPSSDCVDPPLTGWRDFGGVFAQDGVDLTQIDGINVGVAQTLISEVGLDMSRWADEHHFASWLGLCPDHRITGGKVLRRGTRP